MRDPMREYDRLPPELRAWLPSAALPWRPRSVQRAYERAVARTGDRHSALEELSRIERCNVAKDARAIWGPDHPAAML
ncbi:MAG: DUF6525 family protein [Pseudomonadota bacterium]